VRVIAPRPPDLGSIVLTKIRYLLAPGKSCLVIDSGMNDHRLLSIYIERDDGLPSLHPASPPSIHRRGQLVRVEAVVGTKIWRESQKIRCRKVPPFSPPNLIAPRQPQPLIKASQKHSTATDWVTKTPSDDESDNDDYVRRRRRHQQ
jgi:hypothetical protein